MRQRHVLAPNEPRLIDNISVLFRRDVPARYMENSFL